jgi:hypothetical protein
VFQDKDGLWLWNCFAGFGEGDEITFLRKLKGLSLTDWTELSHLPEVDEGWRGQIIPSPESLSLGGK